MAMLELKMEEVRRWQTHALGVTRAIRRAVKVWRGPFTARDIFGLLQRGKSKVTFSAVSQRLAHMEKRGLVTVIQRGAGPRPTVYESVPGTNTGVGMPRGTHHSNTSGLICTLRTALADLPAEFSLGDVRSWLRNHGVRNKRSPGPYLKALVNGGEVEIFRPRNRKRGECQLYRAKEKFGANGDKLSNAEAAWREFRKTITPAGDIYENQETKS